MDVTQELFNSADISAIKSLWNAKNTVFMDLFSIPEYQLKLLQALHPEMTDLTENDITRITLHSVLLNQDYNDLGLLVRDKLIILVEAQSTWTINILFRLLLYLASTYRDYVMEKDLNVYKSMKIFVPEPEFYVIYTGSRKISKDIISLKEDFWNNPDAKLDLIAKVIHLENKNDIAGQYIIFCHVFDKQVKIYGRSKKAVEETLKICQSNDILKAYLETRRKELIEIMDILYDPEYVINAFMRDQMREGEVRGIIKMCKKFGQSIEYAIHEVAESLGFSEKESEEYVNEYWNAK